MEQRPTEDLNFKAPNDADICMVLDTFMYTDYKGASDGQSLREIVNELPNVMDVDGAHKNEYEILRQAVLDPAIGDLTIRDQSWNMGYDEGTNACTFISPDNDKVYVVFRGTADGEWMDNGLGLTQKSTIQQENALRYFDEVMEKEKITSSMHVVPTGHSKGANKVQYIVMESRHGDLVDACYAVDGQGFSNAAVNEWKSRYSPEEYRERTGKLYAINGQNDYVSVLGNCIIPLSHIMYVKTPAKKDDFVAYHDITRMFAAGEYSEGKLKDLRYSGKKNGYVFRRGQVGDYVKGLSDELMGMDDKKLDGCAAMIMKIMESTAGRKDGLNGEDVGLYDCADLVRFGVPAIVYSLLVKKDGTDLIKATLSDNEYSLSITQEDDIYVDYDALSISSDKLDLLSKNLDSLILKLEAESLLLPFYIDGVRIRKYSLEDEIALLKLRQLKLVALFRMENTAATIYRNYDEKTVI